MSNQIFVRPNSDLADGVTVTIEIINLPNPSYTIQEQVTILVQE